MIKPKPMKKTLAIAFSLLLIAQVSKSQDTEKGIKSFKYPVLVKLIQGDGNIFRIGFIRHDDYYDVKQNESEPGNIYASFIDMVDVARGDFKGKCFVYFPFSRENGEMEIADKSDIMKLDMRYEEAIKLIRPSIK